MKYDSLSLKRNVGFSDLMNMCTRVRASSLQMLEHHLGNSFMEKEEIDKKTVIRTNWKKLIKQVRPRRVVCGVRMARKCADGDHVSVLQTV